MVLRLWADFNEVEEEILWTSLRRVSFVPEGEPEIGQRVELYDHEGNACQGIVTKVRGPIVWVRLDLSTWIDAEAVQIVSEYGYAASGSSFGKENRTGVERVAVA
jgi:hypothetical protein